MMIKAKYNLQGNIHYKYFHNIEEMNKFFEQFKMCHFISYDEGEHVRDEALSYGYK